MKLNLNRQIMFEVTDHVCDYRRHNSRMCVSLSVLLMSECVSVCVRMCVGLSRSVCVCVYVCVYIGVCAMQFRLNQCTMLCQK